MIENPYLPSPAKIIEIIEETPDIKTFKLELEREISFTPGQFLEIYCYGVGEMPISISSSPLEKKNVEISVKKVGKVSSLLHEAEVGDIVGVRGPYGNGFPLDIILERDAVLIGGGIGLAPLRSLIKYLLETGFISRNKLYLLYGARSPRDVVFKKEIKRWLNIDEKNFRVYLTVDSTESEEWNHEIGFVNSLVDKLKPELKKLNNPVAIICGPPIMIKFVVKDLLKMKWNEARIFFSLERVMKCGIGKCGHCAIGDKYVCIDGPVFSYKEMASNLEFIEG